MSSDIPPVPTHECEGQFLIQKQDAVGRTYYVDHATGIRAATAGKEVKPFEDGSDPADSAGAIAPAEEEEFEDNLMLVCPRDGIAVAMMAYLEPRGYAERHGFTARRLSESEVELHLPGADGNPCYWITIPETIIVPYRKPLRG